ncbi:hypothetical protein J132_03336 [Termitomyces sp. J132]|nr:hypothetical protein J132_03336 [Termitomyces sp. J132]
MPKWVTLLPHSIILVDANIPTDSYSFLNVTSSDITAIQFTNDRSSLALFNIYNDCTNNNSLTTLSTYFTSSLCTACPHHDDNMLWISDFNHHHPMWETVDNCHLNSLEANIQPLLQLLEKHDMTLALLPGLPTLQTSNNQWTQPDNVWRRQNGSNPIITCEVTPSLCPPNMDHMPITTIIKMPIPYVSQAPSKNSQEVDWKNFNASLKEKLDSHSPA